MKNFVTKITSLRYASHFFSICVCFLMLSSMPISEFKKMYSLYLTVVKQKIFRSFLRMLKCFKSSFTA